jgi:hypothetical protein
MRRKYLFAGLLVAVGLSLPLLRNAWPQPAPPQAATGSPFGTFEPAGKAPHQVPSQAEEVRSQSLSGCLELLKGIREERNRHEEEYKKALAALDGREKDLARTMRRLIEGQRKEIDDAEEELKKIEPEPPKSKPTHY